MSDHHRPPCPPPKLEPPTPQPTEPLRNPLYTSVESVNTSRRDEHVAAFKADMAARRADPSNPWHRKGRKK